MTFTLDQFRLDGRVAVVTGAGGRGNSIGRAYDALIASSTRAYMDVSFINTHSPERTSL